MLYSIPAILISQAKASSNPPPNAAPSIAAIVTQGNFSTPVKDDLKDSTNTPTYSIVQ